MQDTARAAQSRGRQFATDLKESLVPDQLSADSDLAARRAAQDEFWRDGMCQLALAVRLMWMEIGESLGLNEDEAHAITNLAKASANNTLSISELAKASDLSLTRAAAAIDTLLARGMAVRVLPRDGEPAQDRRVQLRGDLVGMIFEYYQLQPHHRGLLDEFTVDDFTRVVRLLEVARSIAADKAAAIRSGEVNPAARLKDLLGGTG